MQHILIEKYDEIIRILNYFFSQNYNRSSRPQLSLEDDFEAFHFACQIYKRGVGEAALNPPMATILPPLQVTTKNDLIEILANQHTTSSYYLVDEFFLKHHPYLQTFFKEKKIYYYLASESTKTLTTVHNIISKIPKNITSLVSIGGGITLDIGGFIAGLLNIPVDYVPTTLLSAVDAAIGGKTGVNFSPYGKNQLGLFYGARSLYFIPEFMSTLSNVDRACGVVEAAKQSYLFGEFQSEKEILDQVLKNKALEKEYALLVEKNFYYKSYVVEQDPYEQNGTRACLNMGHTLAHVLEALAQEGFLSPIPHGLAVAQGLNFLNRMNLINAPDIFCTFIEKILMHHEIKARKKIPFFLIEKILAQDKKQEITNTCYLSLPTYGCFSFNSMDMEKKCSEFLQPYPLKLIAQIFHTYIYRL